MKPILSSQKGDSDRQRTLLKKIRDRIDTRQNKTYLSDGCEFLDDAIRMKDQPLGETRVQKMNESAQTQLQTKFLNSKNKNFMTTIKHFTSVALMVAAVTFFLSRNAESQSSRSRGRQSGSRHLLR